MHVDDRLATVLSASVTGEAAAMTQYRQLVDLLGRMPASAHGDMVDKALSRLNSLSDRLPVPRRAAVLRDPGLRLTSPRVVALLAEGEPDVAAAAIAAAQLDDPQWQALIPRLPIRARGFLRHRKDLETGASALLAQLGIRDLVLTAPLVTDEAEALMLTEMAAATLGDHGEGEGLDLDALPPGDPDEIAILLRRIEAFQKSRGRGGRGGPDSPSLPLAELQEGLPASLPHTFDFATDATGRIVWADPAAAPMVVGARIVGEGMDAPVQADAPTYEKMRRRIPVQAGRLAIEGAPAVSGLWQVDATPRFASVGGSFTGYCGRLRRPPPVPVLVRDPESDRLRELLHELRTPVNAIQGFAEIIQQQLFGPSPHEYRALAAAIAADAAKLLAGFEELDRLAKLESGAIELSSGGCDFLALLHDTIGQLEPFLKSRSADVLLESKTDLAPIALGTEDAAKLAWRLLATLAVATTPGEDLSIALDIRDNWLHVRFELPISYVDRDDVFDATAHAVPNALSAGMFGSGFTLRLARAEARAAGGDLVQDGEYLALTLKVYRAGAVPMANQN